jgi:hypothetical protein
VPSRTIPLDRPLDLRLTLAPHLRGTHDPAMRLGRERAIRATRTPDGPATVALALNGTRLHVEAWGPGADRALDAAPALAGIEDWRDGFAPATACWPTSIGACRASGSGDRVPSSRR